MGNLEGKVAVITGGATGIGRAAAKRFIEEGPFVFIFGPRQEALDAAGADLAPNARAVKGSVSDEADLDRLYAAVKAERGTLDIVFANAGAGSPLALGKITAEHIDETFDTNVKGTIFTVQKALRRCHGNSWEPRHRQISGRFQAEIAVAERHSSMATARDCFKDRREMRWRS